MFSKKMGTTLSQTGQRLLKSTDKEKQYRARHCDLGWKILFPVAISTNCFAVNKSMGDRAFSIIAPKTWNQLPKKVRLNESLQSFKAELKSL